MNEIVSIVEKMGYPIAVSAWLMWFVSAFAGRMQRLVEWAISTKHQLNHIELLLQQIVANAPRQQAANDANSEETEP